jgi:hypothetical protein
VVLSTLSSCKKHNYFRLVEINSIKNELPD